MMECKCELVRKKKDFLDFHLRRSGGSPILIPTPTYGQNCSLHPNKCLSQTSTLSLQPVSTFTLAPASSPEKRQRVPSAYNQFIKEEIQRIKANNPDISHREAFSTAAKNWAHFPHIHFGLMLETNNQAKLDNGSDKQLMSRAAVYNK